MKDDTSDSEGSTNIFLVVVAVLGIVVTVLGLLLELLGPSNAPGTSNAVADLGSKLLTTIGGTFMGSSFGLMFSRYFAPAPIAEILRQLRLTNSNPWCTAEKDLKPFLSRWHGYILTKAQGAYVWRYRIFDFARSPVDGQLHAVVEAPGAREGTVLYRYDGFLTGPRLILIGRREQGAEPCVVQVFPYLSQNNIHAGVTILESWDGDELVTGSLLARLPQVENAQVGTLDAEAGKKLTDIWLREFARNQVALPLLRDISKSGSATSG